MLARVVARRARRSLHGTRLATGSCAIPDPPRTTARWVERGTKVRSARSPSTTPMASGWTRSTWRMPEPYKKTLVGELEAELRSVLREYPTMNIVWASDGAEPQWHALEGIESRLPAECSGDRMKLVDAFHVAEYVQKAADAIWSSDRGEAQVQAATWREMIKSKRDGAAEVLRSMRARLSAPRTASGRKELRDAIDYIARQNSLGRMKYVEAQRRGYPIGTGVTEAAAKTVVGTRMKRAGARFSQHGGQTVMLFRTSILSKRFAALHRALGDTYAARVKEAA
jgi:hypothetical protein